MPRIIGNLTLYSIDDLHEMLGISKMTLRAYLREGRIKGRKLGVSWFVTEESIREYFEQPHLPTKVPNKKADQIRYVVQGVNDLVSETEECETISDALQVLNEQAIISLFQVQIVDRFTNKIIKILKARDFIEQYANT